MIFRAVDTFILAIARQRVLTIILAALTLQILNMYLVTLMVDTDASPGFRFDSALQHFIGAVIVGPLIETLVFQELMITITLKYLRASWTIAVSLSGLAFGLTHPYSLAYMVVTFYIGIFYAMIYLAFREKKTDAYLYVAIIHALYNLYAFVMNRFIFNP